MLPAICRPADSSLSGENPVGDGPGSPTVDGPGGAGGGEPAEPGDPGALIGRERPNGRPTGGRREAGRETQHMRSGRKGEGQRAENAFNNINIGGGDVDGQPARFSQGRQVKKLSFK